MGEESSRTHDVFLSYSSKDKTWADAACACARASSHPVLDRTPRHDARRRVGCRDHQGAQRKPDHGADLLRSRQRLETGKEGG